MIETVGGRDTDRMDALSDGLFAIVLTLLILQFEVPSVAPDELPAAVIEQDTLVFSYLLSFVVVGLYWIGHHNLFRHIVRHDRVLLWLNLLFLLTVSFLPYPTEMLGLYGTRFAWTLYAVNIVLVGVTLVGLWTYATRAGYLEEDIDARTARSITGRGLIAPAVFSVSIAIAAVSLELAFYTPLLIAPLQVLWVRRYRGTLETVEHE
ncbi:TMEM175 family protein [Halalkalicoccus sp. NIPERK01]|uniref:TMEM175 family protein n=1 Tax=Halalkalicoccus sp. NIPERK01 TaxID=3053469 RepID=UPI00256ED1D6|nr:TMEM175 family protein [Halalkalicoccus sp. NIPERK01]MDL5363331.1 TMEM175 family protein [Halalkalicoccus sp. NIPERK01]